MFKSPYKGQEMRLWMLMFFISAAFGRPNLKLSDYFPPGQPIWVQQWGNFFHCWNGGRTWQIGKVYRMSPSPSSYAFVVEGNLLVDWAQLHVTIVKDVLLDFSLRKGETRSYLLRWIPPNYAVFITCIEDDTTITTSIGTFKHCRIYTRRRCNKYAITPAEPMQYRFSRTDTIIIAPEIGFVQRVIYAQVSGKTWGTLPDSITQKDLKGPKYYNPDDPPTSVVVKERFPGTFALHQNYPNPFNGSTTISFELDKPGEIELSIFDIKGHKVTTLFSGFKDTGFYQVKWDAANVPSGVYFVRLSNATEHTIRKMIYTK